MPNARNIIKNRKSKRQTLHQQHKVAKKIKEHLRKVRKDQRVNPKKIKKDPGIPNLWPFKEELIAKLENDKQRAIEEKAARAKRLQAEAAKKRNLHALTADAAKRDKAFEKKSLNNRNADEGQDVDSLGPRDPTRRAYWKEFKRVVEASDVILEVLDARDPIGCRSPAIEQYILKQGGGHKKLVLVLNKIDLVPRAAVEQWLTYLREEFPTVAFKCSTQAQRRNLGQSKSAEVPDNLRTSESLGADRLISLLKNYSRSEADGEDGRLKLGITVGIVGYPNVGKSSLINSLKRSKSVTVGNTPGVTKSMQEIHLDKKVKLLDCPGIVFAVPSTTASNQTLAPTSEQMALLLRNCVKVEQIPDPTAAVEAVLTRCRREQLLKLYSIADFSTPAEFLLQVAQRKGKLKKGGIADLPSAARSVLMDWNGGKIKYYTLPPERKGVHVSSSLVQNWGAAFQLDAAGDSDLLAQLSNTHDPDAVVMSSSTIVDDSGLAHVLDGDESEEDDDDMEDAEDMEDVGEEDEDDEEEDDELALPVRPLGSNSKSGKVRTQRIMTEEEDAINPQVNKQRKKLQKKEKKLAAKSDAYDFNEDFEADDSEADDSEGDYDDEDDDEELDD